MPRSDVLKWDAGIFLKRKRYFFHNTSFRSVDYVYYVIVYCGFYYNINETASKSVPFRKGRCGLNLNEK